MQGEAADLDGTGFNSLSVTGLGFPARPENTERYGAFTP